MYWADGPVCKHVHRTVRHRGRRKDIAVSVRMPHEAVFKALEVLAR